MGWVGGGDKPVAMTSPENSIYSVRQIFSSNYFAKLRDNFIISKHEHSSRFLSSYFSEALSKLNLKVGMIIKLNEQIVPSAYRTHH